MARTTFSTIGIDGLGRDLSALSDDVRQGLGRVCAETAEAVRDKARYFAPRDRGDLRAAIQAKGRGLNWRVGIADGAVAGRGGKNTAHLNPWVYGAWYEYGFVTRQIRQHKFMGPAVDVIEPTYVSKVDALLAQNKIGQFLREVSA